MFELVSQQVPAIAFLAMGALAVIGFGLFIALAIAYYSEFKSEESWEAFKEELRMEEAWAKEREKSEKFSESFRKYNEKARRKARRKGF